MSECGAMQLHERLPDYAHGALDAAERAEIEAHLATCEAARRELALVRSARDAIVRRTPAVDTAAIAAAVRASRRAHDARPVFVLSRKAAWRIAAAIAIVATGALGYWMGTMKSGENHAPSVANVPRTPKLVPAPMAPETTVALVPKFTPHPAPAPAPRKFDPEISVPGAPDLSPAQAGAILNDLEKAGASFETEPMPDFDLGSGL